MTRSDQSVSISIQTKGKLPSLPFVKLKNSILGKRYELSIVFATPATSKALNSKFRNKSHPTNILSFSLSSSTGELVVCPSVARTDASKFEMTYENFLQFLLIHGMLHLNGYVHGSTMEKLEQKWKRRFKLE